MQLGCNGWSDGIRISYSMHAVEVTHHAVGDCRRHFGGVKLGAGGACSDMLTMSCQAGW